MKLTLEQTDKIVTLIVDGAEVPARVWEGRSGGGVPCHAYIVRVAVAEGEDASEFERELRRERPPSPAVAATPARLIL